MILFYYLNYMLLFYMIGKRFYKATEVEILLDLRLELNLSFMVKTFQCSSYDMSVGTFKVH